MINVKKLNDQDLKATLDRIETQIKADIWSCRTERLLKEGRAARNELMRRVALRKLRSALKWNTDKLQVPFSKVRARFKPNSYILADQRSIMIDLAHEKRLLKDKRTFILQI